MKRLLLTITTAFLFIANSFADTGGPDAYGYIWRDNLEVNGPVYNWIDIISRPGATLVENLSDDNTEGPFQTTFPFHFYWYDINQFWIGSNGYIIFQNGQLSAPFPYIPAASQPQNFMAAMASDLNFDGPGNPGQCFYWRSQNLDTMVVSWIDVPFWDPTPPNYYQGTNSFQIILATADSSITYQYKDQSGVYNGGAAVYISAGIENNSGAIGLQSMVNPASMGTYYFTTPYAVKFYFPSNSTYQVDDASAMYNNNPTNGGRFLPNTSPTPFTMTSTVRNTGNTSLASFNVTSRIVNNLNQTLIVDNTQSGALAAGASANLTFTNTWSPTNTGTFVQRSRTFLGGDLVPANDSIPLELVVVDTTVMPLRLTFDDGVPDGVGINWQGGIGGCAMEFTPPFYPCKLTTAHFYIQANPNLVGFYATIYDDNGNQGAPGTRLDSMFVPSANIVAPGWVDVPLTNPIIFNSGKFYVVWNMDGDLLSLGQDLTPPISNNDYEVLGNTFAIYRSREFEDLMINATIDTVFIQVGVNENENTEIFGEFYPNPASQYAVMNFELPAGLDGLSYELYASSGQLVHAEALKQSSRGGNKLVIDIAELPSGIYSCAIKSGNYSAHRKLIISH
ncbi:MAG: T9SS type A sorting domain-containing protein [Bacteroidota bacterium]